MDETLKIICIIVGYLISAGIGFFAAFCLASKTLSKLMHPKGVIRLVYDSDNPEHPVMGLMLEKLEDILTCKTIVLGVQKVNFPDQKDA
jgi:hypothetical protein